jgi:molecular chaperone Hsp33
MAASIMKDASDRIIRATGEVAELRFVLVDLTSAANAVADYHGAQAFARILLGETMASSLLLASGLKGNGTVQVKFQYSGDFTYATADSTPMGLIRATVPQEDIRRLGDFEPMLSPQIMTVRKLNDRGVPLSEGIVEMPSENIGPCTAYYLMQSEQTKSAVGIKAKADAAGAGLLFCGGFLVEALPKADEKTLAIMEQVVRTLPPMDAFLHAGGRGLDLERLLGDLAGPFPHRIHQEIPVQPFCPCSESGVLKAMQGLGRAELEEIVIRGEDTELHCDYCRKRYVATTAQIQALLEGLDGPQDEEP